MKAERRYLYVLIIILSFFAVFALSPACNAAQETIRIADLSWDSVQVHNRIAGFIIKNGYGYDIEYIPGNTIALFEGLARGDLDFEMECWVENQQEAYDKYIKQGKVLDLGSCFPDSWQGWLVPTYVIKGDPERGIKAMAPDLKSISDLPKYWKLFKDPEDPDKGAFYSCIPGWECQKINETKMKTYGLDTYYNIILPGSDAALNGSMAAAYKRGKPWFGYYWAPTWVLGMFDMTPLEEPAFDQEKWNKDYGCAYPSVKVNIVAWSGLQKKAPEVVAFLSNYETTTALTNEFLAYMQDTTGSTDDAAVWFLKNKESLWTSWVPADVATKVTAALK